MINSTHTSDLYPPSLWYIQPQRLGGMPRPPLEDFPGIQGIVSI